MSSIFGMSEADVERRLVQFIPRGRDLICYITSIVILMYILMNSHIFFPNFPIWVVLGLLFMAGIMRRYASFEQNPQRHITQAQTTRGAELSGRAGQHVDVPTFVTRQQLPDIRIQLAELDREFDDSDYDALRALDEDIASNVSAMSEEDINALPIYKFRFQHHQHSQKTLDCITIDENELTCSVCMDHVKEGELIRRLPCAHEIWVVLGLLFMAGIMRWYASFEQNPQRHITQAQTTPGAELSGRAGQQVDVPTFVARQQLPDIRIQLAELDREFDDSDYDALRALDEDIASNVSAMSEEDINALPIYKF